MKRIWIILLFVTSTTQNSSVCSNILGCTCYLDLKGRSVVDCREGGMIGPLVLTNISTAIEILKITAPENNQNELSMNPIFQQFRNLEEIHIVRSNIPNLGEHFFYGLKKLELLNFSQNNITQPLPANFRGISNLNELILDDNRIVSLPSETFRYLTDLRVLSLQKNRISTLKVGVFRFLSKLKVLRLSGNNLEEINSIAFRDISDLRVLECRGCMLTMIDPNVNKFITQLTYLDLSENLITHVNSTHFVDLPKLRILKLDANRLTNIFPEFLYMNTEMRRLHLSQNKISFISLNAFLNLTILEELDLSYNKLKYLKDNVFQVAGQSLRRLVLSGNHIPVQNIISCIKNLTLKDLQIADCGISEMDGAIYPSNITLLNISGNQLSYISALILPTELKDLDISRNMFRGMDEKMVKTITSLQRVKMDNNPWSCDLCHIVPMIENANRSIYLQSVKCALPYYHQNKYLGSLRKEELNWCTAASLSTSASGDASYFLAHDYGKLGILALGGSIVLSVLTIIAVFGAFCYSRRHAAKYYTHEERMGSCNDKESIYECHSPLFGGEELNFTFPRDLKRKISVATVEEIVKEHNNSVMSNGT